MALPSEDDPLVVGSHFQYRNRPSRDRLWGILYGILMALTLVGGIYGIAHRNHRFSDAFQRDFLADPANCPLHGLNSLQDEPEPGQLDLPAFFKQASLWLVVSAVASVLLGIVFLQLFKHQPHLMTKATIASQIAVPLAFGGAALIAGQLGGGLMMLAMAGLAALMFYYWRDEIALCGRLLGVSAHALNSNPGLILLIVVTKIVMTLAVLPIFAFMFLAYTNGHIARNGDVAKVVHSRQCVNGDGQEVPCCAWAPDAWVPPYMSLASVMLLWTVFLAGQFRIFTISGTVAQWYFAPPEATDALKGSTLRSAKFALGPSFGTLSLGSLVLTLIELARQALQQARDNRQDGQNLLWSLLSCCLQCIWGLIEYITKFATIRAAITGEAFFEAGRNVTDLLMRNALKAYGVWWFPPLVLQLAAFVLSAAWGVLIYLISYFAWHSQPQAQAQAIILGVLSFFMAWVVQAFFASVLLDIVNAVFICYAMDKDTHSVTNPEVHEVFSQVPVGVAVEQPGGEYAYGAPVPGGYAPPNQVGSEHDRYPGATAPPPQFARHGQGTYDSQARV
ncbi:g5284 [Coccomyxa viridis]|uniref:Choline transporter-like protein n=1 Tax=Coccomyxa viridis TaxID=1274662 RepID=A0ABP1FSG0_9CHLO